MFTVNQNTIELSLTSLLYFLMENRLMEEGLSEKVDSSVASSLLLEHYGLMAEKIKELPGEYDSNFCITVTGGSRVTFKVMHSSRSFEEMEMQAKALIHVSTNSPEVVVPRTMVTKQKHLFARVALNPVTPAVLRFVWVMHWLEGKPFALAQPRAEPLLRSFGEAVGSLSKGFAGFKHSGTKRDLKWDILKAGWIRPKIDTIEDPSRRALIYRVMDEYEANVLPAERSGALPRGVIHGDANDYNVLTLAARGCHPRVSGILDFGDMHDCIVVADLAIAIAYGIGTTAVPLDSACTIVSGYVSRTSLCAAEVNVLWSLVATRLAVSVVNSAIRKQLDPNDPYIVISEVPAWESLIKMSLVPNAVASAALRVAAGMAEPHATPAHMVDAACDADQNHGRPLIDVADALVDTFGEGEVAYDDPSRAFDWASLPGVSDMDDVVTVKAHNNTAHIYHCARFTSVRPSKPHLLVPGVEPAHCLLGLGLLLARGESLRSPRASTVVGVRTASSEHASALLLRHDLEDANHKPIPCWTLWTNLEVDELLQVGSQISPREYMGTAPRNGLGIIVSAWAGPHAIELAMRAPLWVRASDAPAWCAAGACDPARLIRLRSPLTRLQGGPVAPFSNEAAAKIRAAVFGTNVRLSYAKPIRAVRGEGPFLIDARGVAFVDAYNNVPSVGHSHPRVALAIAAAAARLQTNTRYLNDSVLSYSQQLVATFPSPLSVVFLVASGSEANELALRIARAATGREDVICLDHAYHGHTAALIDVSPYKFNSKGGKGKPATTHVSPCPDVYRGPFRRNDEAAGEKYAAAGVGAILESGVLPAAFIAETLPSVAGQIELPHGYLAAVYKRVRAAGGVCIADEIQTGFGRLGPDAFWAFQTHSVVPDIITLGKPIGNGFPMGAVITTRELAAKFDNGMEYFCTGGGGPCAAAAGTGVLDVLMTERLPESAARVGETMKIRLQKLMATFPLLGDVRGRGLFLGIEIVRNRVTLEEGDEETDYIVNRLRNMGVLCGTEGPKHSVIKIRPPLCFSEANAAYLYNKLVEILSEDGLAAGALPEVKTPKPAVIISQPHKVRTVKEIKDTSSSHSANGVKSENDRMRLLTGAAAIFATVGLAAVYLLTRVNRR